MANAITKVITWLSGEYIGMDERGNKYYQERQFMANTPFTRRRRWVVYDNKRDEASEVPPLYHSWLHYTSDDFPNDDMIKKYSWMKEHQANLTGTKDAYFPKGYKGGTASSSTHMHMADGARPAATGDYQAWKPE